MKPTVTVTPPKTASDSLYHSKITALLLVLLDVTVIAVIVTHGGIAVTEMPLWTLCLLLWGIALVLVLIGIWTSKTKFFIPAYVVWIATFISSILFIIVDAYVSTFCENSAKNKTGRWNSPCDAFLQRKGSFSCYLLLMLLKHVQLFHTRTLSLAIDAKKRGEIPNNEVQSEPWYTERKPSWLRAKVSVSHPRKDAESDDDDMIVFEKIAGAFKGDRPKINDMGKSSIA
ncbi:hypothetical protein Q1695_001963 [Nippostrongylus brasiliensis]|nr:hypothetical protein Q1695_001963 [Nippostrongylus brasiliensis]